MVSCSVLGCKSDARRKIPDVSFHSFPNDGNIRQQWIDATGRTNWTPKKDSRLCSLHFDKKNIFKKIKKTFLSHNAVPLLEIKTYFSTTSASVSSRTEENIKTPIPPAFPSTSSQIGDLIQQEPAINQQITSKCDISTSNIETKDYSTGKSDLCKLKSQRRVRNSSSTETCHWSSSAGVQSDDEFIDTYPEADEYTDRPVCSNCQINIIDGCMLVCVQCPDALWCGACAQLSRHAQHYLLRVPRDRPQAEINEVINSVKTLISKHTSSENIIEDSTYFDPDENEIKLEPGDIEINEMVLEEVCDQREVGEEIEPCTRVGLITEENVMVEIKREADEAPALGAMFEEIKPDPDIDDMALIETYTHTNKRVPVKSKREQEIDFEQTKTFEVIYQRHGQASPAVLPAKRPRILKRCSGAPPKKSVYRVTK